MALCERRHGLEQRDELLVRLRLAPAFRDASRRITAEHDVFAADASEAREAVSAYASTRAWSAAGPTQTRLGSRMKLLQPRTRNDACRASFRFAANSASGAKGLRKSAALSTMKSAPSASSSVLRSSFAVMPMAPNSRDRAARAGVNAPAAVATAAAAPASNNARRFGSCLSTMARHWSITPRGRSIKKAPAVSRGGP